MPNKGEIAVSKDADIILVDPNQSYVVKREDLYYKNKHSAYEGRKIDCRVTKTIFRGNVVFDLKKESSGNQKENYYLQQSKSIDMYNKTFHNVKKGER